MVVPADMVKMCTKCTSQQCKPTYTVHMLLRRVSASLQEQLLRWRNSDEAHQGSLGYKHDFELDVWARSHAPLHVRDCFQSIVICVMMS